MRPARSWAVVCAVVCSLVFGCGAGGVPSVAPDQAMADALPAGAVVVYDEALRPGWADWSWGTTRNWAATSPVAAGTRSLSVVYSAWGALYLRRDGASIAGTTTLTLKVNGGSNTGLKLAVLGVTGTTQLTRVDLAPYCAAKAIPRNAWTKCQVPLSALGPAGTVFDAFQLQERNGTSHSAAFFDDIGLTGGAAPTVPAAPTSLTATPSTGAVTLSWTAVTGATGYEVSRATASAGPFTKLTSAPQAATTYRDGAASAGSTYWYRVAAVNAAGTGPASAVVSAAVPAPPAVVTVAVAPAAAALDACAKTKLTATVSGAADASVTWSVQEGAAGGSIDATGTYTAPTSAGTYHVVARSNASTTAAATATVTIQERILSIAVTPTAASVPAGGQVQLASTVTTTCGTFAAQ